MSRAKLKNAVARIMREANIDFEKIDQETIWKRHRARLTLIKHDFISVLANHKSCEPTLRGEYRKMLRDPAFKKEVKQARSLLKDDTPDRWAADQAAIEAHELRKYGTLEYAKRNWAYGADYDAMLLHWIDLLEEPERNRREHEEGRLAKRAELEKKYGKPVSLTGNDPSNIQYRCYTPTFAGGKTIFGVGYLYPFSDFPEYGGKHRVELDNEDK